MWLGDQANNYTGLCRRLCTWCEMTRGLHSILLPKWIIYFLRTTQLDGQVATELLQPLESAIRSQFLPSLTGTSRPGDLMRALLALPCSLGGLNVVNPIDAQFSTSKRISAPLVDLIFRQEHQLHDCYAVQQHIKSVTCQVRCTKQKELAGNLYTFVSSSTLH